MKRVISLLVLFVFVFTGDATSGVEATVVDYSTGERIEGFHYPKE